MLRQDKVRSRRSPLGAEGFGALHTKVLQVLSPSGPGRAHQRSRSANRVLGFFGKPKLLIVDELGYLLFERRFDRRYVADTSQKPAENQKTAIFFAVKADTPAAGLSGGAQRSIFPGVTSDVRSALRRADISIPTLGHYWDTSYRRIH
jgi:hypothetical protein